MSAFKVRIQGRESEPSGVPTAPGGLSTGRLPSHCVFDTFYAESEGSDRRDLKLDVFFRAPKDAAEQFRRAELKTGQLRMLFQGYRSFCSRLAERKISFNNARELFSEFYVQRIIRQHQRRVIPAVVVELFDKHRDLILREEAEMNAFFKYLTNILCYFGDKDK